MDAFIVLLGAVREETGPLLGLVEDARPVALMDTVVIQGRLRNHPVLIGDTGIGKINAAIVTAAILSAFPGRAVWNLGCAGAFAGSGLATGDVLISEKVFFGDEGVLTAENQLSMESIGIPLMERDGEPVYESLNLSDGLQVLGVRQALPAGAFHPSVKHRETGALSDSFHIKYGTSLTVGMASGDPPVADERLGRYGAHTEDMEGAAVALAAARAGVPVVICRGVSNTTGDRDKRRWHFRRAVHHSSALFLEWLTDWAG